MGPFARLTRLRTSASSHAQPHGMVASENRRTPTQKLTSGGSNAHVCNAFCGAIFVPTPHPAAPDKTNEAIEAIAPARLTEVQSPITTVPSIRGNADSPLRKPVGLRQGFLDVPLQLGELIRMARAELEEVLVNTVTFRGGNCADFFFEAGPVLLACPGRLGKPYCLVGSHGVAPSVPLARTSGALARVVPVVVLMGEALDYLAEELVTRQDPRKAS